MLFMLGFLSTFAPFTQYNETNYGIYTKILYNNCMLFIFGFQFTLAPFTQYNAKLYSNDILMIFSIQAPGADPGFQVRGRT
jgi:hypothetical protein